MENWIQKRIKDFAYTASGGTPSTSVKEYWEDGTIPWINSGELSQNDFIKKPTTYISEKALRSSSAKLMPVGTVVIALTGATTGMSALLEIETSGNQSITGIFPSEKHNPKFLLYLLQRDRNRIIGFNIGSAQPHINKHIVDNLQFLLPKNVNEQTQIAEIISTSDDAIEQTEKLIAKYQRIKTGLMQDLLTRGIDEHGNIRSKATHKFVLKKGIEVPEDWDVKQLNDCIDKSTVITYGIVQTGPHIEDGVRVLRTIDLQGDKIISTSLLRTTEQISNSYKRTILKKYDIVCNVRASVGDFNIIDDENLVGCNTTRGVARISPHKEIDPYYLLWYLRTEKNKRQMELLIKGTTFIDINIADLRKIPVPFPVNLGEQQKISNKLNQISNLIESTRIKLNKLHLIKTGLMQDLLSGWVRVNVNEN